MEKDEKNTGVMEVSDVRKKVKKQKKPVGKRILTVVFILFSFYLGYFIREKGYFVKKVDGQVTINREVPVDKNLDFSLFWRIWDTLSEKYFDPGKLDDRSLVYGAIKGMVEAVGDPYTVFLPPDENRVVEEDLLGTFEGVGIQIGFKGTRLAVIAPLPDSPAEKAGLKAGDLIVGIVDETKDIDRSTDGITLPEAVEIIRGPAGSKITLIVLREGDESPMTFDVTREAIDVPSIILTTVNEDGETDDSGHIAHLRLLKFSGETTDEWNKNVSTILSNPNIDSIVLDLRNNPGGYLQGAVDIASDFLELGSTVVVEEDSKGEQNEYKTEKIGKLTNKKLVVLINQGSASASEILAGALRDQVSAKLVGETSFGKGTIQEPIQINGNLGLHVTVAKWLTPSKFWVNEVGLTPDSQVEDNPDTAQDEQLLEAIKDLN